MGRALSLASLSLVACTLNPAFDVLTDVDPGTSTDTTADTSTSTSTSPTTSDETSPPPPTTTDAPPVTTGTTTGTTTAALDTTTTPADTTDDTSTTDETDTESTDNDKQCWNQLNDTWSSANSVVLDQFEDDAPADPVLSADGLAIVYMATPDRQPFRSTRGAFGDPFPNGMQISLWPGDANLKFGYPRLSQANGEMLVSGGGDVYVAKFKDGDINKQYDDPVPLGSVNDVVHEESITTINEAGTILLVQRNDGPPIPPSFIKSYRFYQFRRTEPSPGKPFESGQNLTPSVAPHDLALCPTLSPDGLHLFFSSTTAPVLDSDNADEVVRIFHTSRITVDSGWSAPTELSGIQPAEHVLCPTSVTDNGCAMTYIEFAIDQDQDPAPTPTMYLLERTPS